MTSAYPREAARTLRHAERARRQADLQAAKDAVDGAAAEVARLRDALAAHREGRPDLGEGVQSATALRRGAQFARAHGQSERRLRDELAAAEARLDATRRAFDRARAELGDAYAAERQLDRDRHRFETDARREHARREEEEADEAAGRRAGRR